MSPHSRRQDRAIPAEYPDVSEDGQTASARFEAVEEGLIAEADTLPRPAGFGTEASRSAQSFATIDEYVVPDGHIAHIREASLSIESNGEALVNVGGVQYGSYTGAVDMAVPLDPGILPPGGRVVIKHQSTDGASTTTKAQVVALEV